VQWLVPREERFLSNSGRSENLTEARAGETFWSEDHIGEDGAIKVKGPDSAPVIQILPEVSEKCKETIFSSLTLSSLNIQWINEINITVHSLAQAWWNVESNVDSPIVCGVYILLWDYISALEHSGERLPIEMSMVQIVQLGP